ncbi:hypothetical protein [Streptomyces pseudovenezuelae]|uniref:Lipoprotein n=1 Tax=Streptomyces pseudovenezuelae TaxID=67350 RepID=A0ABT6LV59_9ACTN|nr:hypothetical protein [Streptomyces pseudovenezuelae]MDH6220202.1 hypothetical protein [Streptomyces pseudovenezuelae]
MSGTTRGPAPSIGALALPVLLLLLTGCATEKTTKVSAAGVVGTWKGPGGEQISLGADHAFTSSGLDSKNLAGTGCPAEVAGGSWGFMVAHGNSGFSSETAKSGSWIGLGFKVRWECGLSLAVVDDGETLCATDDPGAPCGLGVRLTRRK